VSKAKLTACTGLASPSKCCLWHASVAIVDTMQALLSWSISRFAVWRVTIDWPSCLLRLQDNCEERSSDDDIHCTTSNKAGRAATPLARIGVSSMAKQDNQIARDNTCTGGARAFAIVLRTATYAARSLRAVAWPCSTGRMCARSGARATAAPAG
jgi:hypothetical protein